MRGPVTGVIGLSGWLRGTVSVHCPGSLALPITEAMMGEPIRSAQLVGKLRRLLQHGPLAAV